MEIDTNRRLGGEPMRDGRWITVIESEFTMSGAAYDIRSRLPDNDPWHAWSNFTFPLICW